MTPTPSRRLGLTAKPLFWIMLAAGVFCLLYATRLSPVPDILSNRLSSPPLHETVRLPALLVIIGSSLVAGAIAIALFNRNGPLSLAVLMVVALIIRLAFAFGFYGTGDVTSYYRWTTFLQEGGNIYRCFELYHWPPLPIFMVGGLGRISAATGLPLYGLVALPMTLADLVIGYLIYLIASEEGLPTRRRVGYAALYLLNPAAVLVSGYHPQYGSVYMFPVLLACYALVYKKRYKLSALALGGGMAVVLTPLLFIPAFLAGLDNWRKRFVFVVLCGTPLLVLTLPYLIDNFWMVIGGFTGYSSEYGSWGSSYLLRWFTENVWAGPGEGFRGYAITYGSYGLLLALAFFGFAVFPRMQLKHALTFTMLVFYLNPTGFANQYIILLLPFLILEFENRTAIWYTILASVFGIVVYIGGYVLPPAVLDLFPVWPRPGMILSMPIWAFCVWEFVRRLLPHIRHGIALLRRSQPPGSAVVDASKT